MKNLQAIRRVLYITLALKLPWAGQAVVLSSDTERIAMEVRKVQAGQVIGELYGAQACHDIQTYPIGSGWGLSLHCLPGSGLTLHDAHAVSAQIEGRLRDTIPRLERVIVHTEPSL